VEVVLIDKFVVPEESKVAFLTEVRKSSAFLRTLPGFVEGFVYESTDGGSRHNVVTTGSGKMKMRIRMPRRAQPRSFRESGSILQRS
jgi:hypothetical protein